MTEMRNVRGEFHDEAQVRKAVEQLLERSVPVDQITVTVLDPSGAPRRDVPVEDEMGVLHGAVIGAAVGGGLGLAAAVFGTGFYAGWPELISAFGLSWMVRGLVIGVVGGLPLGGILGMGRWRKDKELEADDLDAGSVVVDVRSNELADLARKVLEKAGADRVTITG